MGDYFVDVAVNLQKKYNMMNEIYDLTKQMQEAFYRKDMYSLKLIVNMRTNAILENEKIENERQDLISKMNEEERQSVLKAINEKEDYDVSSATDILKKINEINTKVYRAWEHVMVLDKVLNKKVNSGSSDNTY